MLLPHLKKQIQISAKMFRPLQMDCLCRLWATPKAISLAMRRFLPECKSQTQTRRNGLLLLRTTIIIRTTTAKA